MFLQIGTPQTAGGTTAASPAKTEIIVTNPSTNRASYAREVVVKNTGATNALKVFLTGLAIPITVAANSEERLNGPIHRLLVSAAAATTTYEVFFSVA